MSNQNLEVKVNAFMNAVQLLFHSNDNEKKKKANKFLVELEKNADSWDIAYQVLLKDNLPEEIYFNALQILRNKIKYDFGNYTENPEYIEKLLFFLVSNIDKYKNYKHYLLLKYCDCIGKAFLFTGDKFKTILVQFTNKLYGQNSDINSLISLLLIFNYMNETAYDKDMVIDQKTREVFKKNISSIAGDVFQFIILMINKLNEIQNDNNLKKFIINQLLETLINYINIKLDDNVILKFNKEYLPIIDFIFQINEENLEKHSECICFLLQFPLHKDNMRTLAQYIFSKILNFKDIFYKSIETLDSEQSSFYIDVFTSMVDNNLEEILNEKRYDLIQIIVDLTKNCPPIKINVICEFFEKLNIYFCEKNYSVEDVMKIFKNMFLQLIQNLIYLTKFEENIFTQLNNSSSSKLENDDEYNATMDYRTSIKEFMEDFIYNYGFYIVFDEIIFPEFKNIVIKIKENQKNISLWNKLENILYLFSCISREINPQNKSFENVSILFYTIFEIPKEFSQITRTITDIIDNCSKIFSSDKNLLFKVFKYLVIGLENKLTLKYCSESAKYILSDNKEIMAEIKIDLIKLYNDKLKDKILLSNKYLGIIEGLIEVITFSKTNGNENDNIKDDEIIQRSLVEILKPWVLYLQEAKKILEKDNSLSSKDKNKFNDLLIILKYTSKSAFEGLSQNNEKIMNDIFNEIWPLLTFFLNKMSSKEEIVENIIQLIKIFMRGLNNNFIKFVPEYIDLMIKGYKSVPISSYLYGIEILVEFENDKNEEIISLINKAFNDICYITLTVYMKNEFDLNILIEIGYDFFGMLFRIMRKSPIILLDSPYLQNIINSALIYFNTNEIQDVKNIITFFEYILCYEDSSKFKDMKKNNNMLYEKYKNIIQNQINNISLPLTGKILNSFVDAPTEGVIENIIDLFKEFIKYQKPLIIKGMQYHLKNISNDILTNKEKEEFINIVNNFSLKEKEFDNFIYNFKNRCISKQIRDKGKN